MVACFLLKKKKSTTRHLLCLNSGQNLGGHDFIVTAIKSVGRSKKLKRFKKRRMTSYSIVYFRSFGIYLRNFQKRVAKSYCVVFARMFISKLVLPYMGYIGVCRGIASQSLTVLRTHADKRYISVKC